MRRRRLPCKHHGHSDSLGFRLRSMGKCGHSLYSPTSAEESSSASSRPQAASGQCHSSAHECVAGKSAKTPNLHGTRSTLSGMQEVKKERGGRTPWKGTSVRLLHSLQLLILPFHALKTLAGCRHDFTCKIKGKEYRFPHVLYHHGH